MSWGFLGHPAENKTIPVITPANLHRPLKVTPGRDGPRRSELPLHSAIEQNQTPMSNVDNILNTDDSVNDRFSLHN